MAITFDNLLKLSTLKKILILIGILFLISGVYYYFFYMPKQKEINMLEDKLGRLQEDLSKKQVIVKRLAEFKEEVARLNEELAMLLVQLPNKKEIPDLLSNISRLGKETGLDFLLFKPKSEVEQDFYAEIPVDIKVLGSFHNVAAFFDKISKLSRIVNMTNISMTKPVISGREVHLTTSCMATTFKFLGKKEKSENKKK